MVLWELLAARRLFHAEDDAALLSQIFHQIVKGNVEPPSKYAPALPRSIDAIVLKGLASKPEDRFASGRDMAIAIEKAAMLATPREVGEWVEKTAGEVLKKKADRITEVESISSMNAVPQFRASGPESNRRPLPEVTAPSEPPTIASLPAHRRSNKEVSTPSVSQATTLSVSQPAPAATKPAVLIAAVLAIALITGAAAVTASVLILRKTGPEPAATLTATTTTASAPATTSAPPAASSAPMISVSSLPVDTSTPSPDASGSADAGAIATAAPPVKTAGPPVGPVTGKPPVKKAPVVSCDPPYVIDGTGIKRYKPECVK